MKKKALIVMLIAVFFIASAFCGGSNESSGTKASTEKRDSINLTLNQVVETLNPFDSANIVDMQLFWQLYETPFFLSDSGELIPRLAESYTVSEDGLTYTLKIKEGVKFHNGATMTAEDMAWSLQYSLKDGPFTKKRNNLGDFESAVAIDENTVQIKSKNKSAAFMSNIALYGYIVCKDEFLKSQESGKLGIEWVPYGTGPYMVSSYNPDSMIVLKAFDDYYRGKARIETVNYQILSDNNTISVAFEAGDLDFIVVPTAKWASISSDSRFNTYLSPTQHTSFFHVNINNNDALSNKLVRQAISYGIDREAMTIIAYDGIATPAYCMFNPSTVYGGFTLEEMKAAGITTYEYNPEKAKALLAEAGYPNGIDIGTITCINGSYWEKMSTAFQDNMADIGITVRIELADSASCRSLRKEHKYNLATTGTNYSPDASYGYQYFRVVTDEERANGVYSELDLSNQELNDLYIEAMGETDGTKRRSLWLDINRIIQDEMYSIPTFYKAIPYAYQKNLVCEEINTNYYYIYNFYWDN